MPKIFDVTIERPGGSRTAQGTGMVKTATGGYRLPDAGVQPVQPIDGVSPSSPSSYPARYYRKPAAFQAGWRNEGEAGVSTNVDRQVLSIRVPNADVRASDVAVLPAGTVYPDRPCRATIVLVRVYPTGVQCDLETGSVGKEDS